ncbi:MAG: FkbM family methyltransferase [Gloeomargaritaceae cyanobacterium C42_A2020_066]|nr:FkbM family methyltransferase [Gloeomargaritaceae cyanobacterium C42_A2020_066]
MASLRPTLGLYCPIGFCENPHTAAIDIGANIGDSAALIRSNASVPILCIEGNPLFIPYLIENSSKLGGISLVRCFVGGQSGAVSLDNIQNYGGTATFQSTSQLSHGHGIPIRTLNDIVAERPDFRESKLLKIDTDGHDFDIIQYHVNFLERQKPVIFFEYDITFEDDGPMEGLQTLECLVQSGYLYFVVYDNFGNYLGRVENGDVDRLIDLTVCLVSQRFLSGNPAIYYLDMCGFTDADHDLFSKLVSLETQVLFGDPPPYE